MKNVSWLATLVTGAALGAVVVIACSDDSPGDADAGTCECPAAEPPIAGRVARIRGTVAIDPNAVGVQGAICPAGATLLGGSCRLMDGDPRIVLNDAGIVNGGGQGYQCQWKSSSPVADTGIAEAICLMPAQ